MKRRVLVGTACAIALVGGVVLASCSGGEPPTMTVTPPSGPANADGKTAAVITVRVSYNGKGVDGGELHAASSLDGSTFTKLEEGGEPSVDDLSTDTTLNSGTATLRLYSVTKGIATVTLTYRNDELGITDLSKTIDVVFSSGGNAAVKTLKFISAEPGTLQLKGSGGADISAVKFQALDSTGNPVKGVTVKFSIGNALGGASIDPESAVSDDQGFVTTNLSSGTAVGAVRVTAKTGADPVISSDSEPITIAGGAANYNNLTFSCQRFAIAGFFRVGLQMECYADVADRKTQKIANTQVTFMVEAGAIDRTIYTDENGRATSIYKTQDPKPVDVNPNPAYLPAFLVNTTDNGDEPQRVCPARTTGNCNPRDGLVTAIAVTSGEEAFVDRNQNGKWDSGEDFTDLPEPYVDVNDNNRFDVNDPVEKGMYIDANNNGVWDDKNGKWDSSTQIWKPAKFVWTGGVNDNESGFFSKATHQRVNSVTVAHCDVSDPVQLLIVDDNLNMPAAEGGDEITCEYSKAEGNIVPGTMKITDDDLFGRKFLPANGLRVEDAHTCSPDCLHEMPPSCAAVTGLLTCSGIFQGEPQGGGSISVSAQLSVTVR